MAIAEVKDSNFESVILQSDCVLVDFWASWCRPCKALLPKIEQIASEFPKLLVQKMNIDDNPDSPAKYGVKSIPTLILFKKGEALENLVGNISYDKIKECVAKHLN